MFLIVLFVCVWDEGVFLVFFLGGVMGCLCMLCCVMGVILIFFLI